MVNNEKKEEGFKITREGVEDVLKIDANRWPYLPAVESSPEAMSYVIDKLSQSPQVRKIILNQRRNYVYDYDQTQLLMEVARIYNHLLRQRKALSYASMGDMTCQKCFPSRYGKVEYILLNLLRRDPLGAYVEVKRLYREEKIRMKGLSLNCVNCQQTFLDLLAYLHNMFEGMGIIQKVKGKLEGYRTESERDLYKFLFRPMITPDFIFTKLMAEPPLEGEQMDVYSVGESDVSIFKIPGQIQHLYHLVPPEFKITEDHYTLLDLARNVLVEHRPREEEFLEPERMRQTFSNISLDLLQELAEHKEINVDLDQLKDLAKILVRYTVGFGLIEVLMQDPKVQDVVINGPIGQTPIFLVHQDYDECVTNIYPSHDDAESWSSKMRMLSGRPLDEANPVLDTELRLPGSRVRVAVITNPLSPSGYAYSLRRHRDKPWTLPLFVKNRMVDPLGAGLLSFLIDGNRTLLVAGTRGSGKTSLLGSLMVEVMRRYRLLTVEDTLELPVDALRKLGYNVQSMKVRAALTSGGTEISADEGIRTSLRMGDSALIVGEVRSTEAKALYEAMRVGALANVVAGTIHGASPYGVFDRVVNDLGVPRTSFKATDIIIVSNPVRSSDGLHRYRRVLQIAEVRKHWEDDPLREGGFVDLMKYDTKTDMLQVTEDLKNGESDVLKDIAGGVKGWAGNWDAVWDNIVLRSKIKKALVDFAEKSKREDLLEADFVIQSNDMFHQISNTVREDAGELDSKRIYNDWEHWLKDYVNKKSVML